jgi:hypothetical protein
MIRSRSAFSTFGLDLSAGGSWRREQAREPGSSLLFGLSLRLSLELRVRRLLRFQLVVDHAQQLLVPPALGETLEVSADRGTHLVEMALFAHGG